SDTRQFAVQRLHTDISSLSSQREGPAQPRRNDAGNVILPAVVEVIAVGHDLDFTRTHRRRLEFLRGIAVAVFLVAPYVQDRALHPRRETDDIRHRRDAVEKAFGGDHPPPPWHEHE